MAKLEGQQQFEEANRMLNGLWLFGDPTKTKDFRDLCWSLLNINAGVLYALTDIHNHIRKLQQQSTQPPAVVR
jgi:hypothetical protein